ncbi:WD40 repeat domain-containing serine/threonine-protein kinase [Myxococcota bacterium]|nr:WD40 repeat domain-containing serine/threonine-protein kinase [Myxococcota bacterium]
MGQMSKTPSWTEPSQDAEAASDPRGDGATTFSLEEGPPVISVISAARYVAAQEVGRGALGAVEAVTDQQLGRRVARKRLIVEGSAHRERFLRETRITARLEHPNIVPLYDVGTQPDGSPWYTMRLLPGRTLSDAMARAQSRAERHALLDHVLDACQAMAYAHARGVIHRDLKPENVVVGGAGETWVVDWGLAVALPGSPLADGPPPRWGVAGTPSTMAPEQARGEALDARADVFALGAILFELLTGAPLRRGDAKRMLEQAATAPPPTMRRRNVRVHPALAAIVEKALCFEPAGRYADAGALSEDLRAWSAGQRVNAYSYSPVEALRLLYDRYRWQVRVGLATLSFASVVLALAVRQVRAERDHALAAERDRAQALGVVLAARASDELAMGDPLMASLYAAESLRYADRPEARGVLARTAAMPMPTLARTQAAPGGCEQLDLVPGGTLCGSVQHISLFRPGGELAWRHEAHARRIAPSPDGARVAVATGERLLVLDARDGEVLEDHALRATAVGWSSDGLLVGGLGGRLRRGDLDDTQSDAAVLCGGLMADVSWAQDNQRLGIVCTNGRFGVFDREGRALGLGRVDSASFTMAFHPTSGRLVLGSFDGLVELAAPGEAPLRRFVVDGGVVTEARWSPDGRWLAASTDQGEIVVWDGDTGRRLFALTGLGFPGASIVFSDDSRQLTTSGGAGDLRVWDLPAPTPEWFDAELGVGFLSVDAARGLLYTTDGLNRAVSWRAADRRRVAELFPAGSVLVTPTSRGALVLTTHHGWQLVDPFNGLILEQGASTKDDPIRKAWTLANGDVMYALRDKPDRLITFDPEHPDVRTERVMDGPISRAWSSPGGVVLALMGTTLHLLDEREGLALLQSLPAAEDLRAATLSPDRRLLVMSDAPPDLTVIDLQTGAKHTLKGHLHYPIASLWLSDTRLVTTSWDDTLRVWDVPTGRCIAVLAGHSGRVVDVGRVGDTLYSASWDRTVRAWSLSVLDATPALLLERAELITGLRITDDGRTVRVED